MNHNIAVAAILSVAGCIALPLWGFLINLLIQIVLGGILRSIDHSGKLYMVLVNYLTFPGVVWHELSHAFFAFISGAKVTEVALYKKEGDSLGHVNLQTRGNAVAASIQLALSACAPVVMGVVGIIAIYFVLLKVTLPIWGTILLIYFGVCILIHMDMSPPDIKCYIKGVWVFFLILFVVALVVLFCFPNVIEGTIIKDLINLIPV